MDSTVKAGFKEGKYIIFMDEKIDKLRKEIWKTIFTNKKIYLMQILVWRWE